MARIRQPKLARLGTLPRHPSPLRQVLNAADLPPEIGLASDFSSSETSQRLRRRGNKEGEEALQLRAWVTCTQACKRAGRHSLSGEFDPSDDLDDDDLGNDDLDDDDIDDDDIDDDDDDQEDADEAGNGQQEGLEDEESQSEQPPDEESLSHGKYRSAPLLTTPVPGVHGGQRDNGFLICMAQAGMQMSEKLAQRDTTGCLEPETGSPNGLGQIMAARQDASPVERRSRKRTMSAQGGVERYGGHSGPVGSEDGDQDFPRPATPEQMGLRKIAPLKRSGVPGLETKIV